MNLIQSRVIASTHTGRSSCGSTTKVLFALALAVLVVSQCWGESTPNVIPDNPVECVANHEPVRVTTRVDRSSAQIADKITLTLSVATPTGVQVSFPETNERLGEFDVVGIRDTLDIPLADGRLSTRSYQLESLTAGELTIPAISIPFLDKTDASPKQGIAMSEPIRVRIKSLLEGETDPTQFRDIKGLVAIERPESSRIGWLAIGAGVLFVASAAYFFVGIKRRNRELSPKDWALSEIDYLASLSDEGSIDAERFYTEVTDIVRVYVERQFEIAARRLTTSEFFARIQNGEKLGANHVSLLSDFLCTADMVKFAGLEMASSEAADATSKARQFIQESAAADAIGSSAQEAA